jgi:hypothetical protein
MQTDKCAAPIEPIGLIIRSLCALHFTSLKVIKKPKFPFPSIIRGSLLSSLGLICYSFQVVLVEWWPGVFKEL